MIPDDIRESSGDEHVRPSGGGLVTICYLPLFQADLARAKLQAEGIPAFVIDENVSITLPYRVPVRLLVHESDVRRAEMILSQPPPEMPGEYLASEFRCPKCRSSNTELLPLGSPWKQVRLGCLFIVAVAAFLSIALTVFPNVQWTRSESIQITELVSILIAFSLGMCLWSVRRSHRCGDCGHVWCGK